MELGVNDLNPTKETDYSHCCSHLIFLKYYSFSNVCGIIRIISFLPGNNSEFNLLVSSAEMPDNYFYFFSSFKYFPEQFEHDKIFYVASGISEYFEETEETGRRREIMYFAARGMLNALRVDDW